MELKPCPFCGGEAAIGSGEEVRTMRPELYYYIQCQKCRAVGWSYPFKSAEQGIEQWNRRYDDKTRKES